MLRLLKHEIRTLSRQLLKLLYSWILPNHGLDEFSKAPLGQVKDQDN